MQGNGEHGNGLETPLETGERYEPTDEDRKALIAELRAQIRSGTYKPSIGRISVSICGALAEE